MVSRNFDVAVIGAGPAGSTTARHLVQRGCRVVLIEGTQFEEPRVGESLAPSVQPLLISLGLWREFMALDPLPSFGTRSLWGQASPQEHSHLMSPYGSGWHVDRLEFDRMLAVAAATAGAELRRGTVLVSCEVANGGSWLLRLGERGSGDTARRSSQLRARVLIDATGRAAHLSRRVGARRIMFDRLVGVATLFSGIDTSRGSFILLESSREGWWYSAPVPPDRLMVMLMTDSDLCGRAKLSTRARWRELLSGVPATFARAAGPMVWGPRVFSAISQRLHRSELNSPWIAVGDAALAVDPISGSGVVRALRSAQAGAETVLALLNGQPSPTIKAYEADLDLACTTYLLERAHYYGMEQRWQESTFWQRRAAAVAQVASSRP